MQLYSLYISNICDKFRSISMRHSVFLSYAADDLTFTIEQQATSYQVTFVRQFDLKFRSASNWSNAASGPQTFDTNEGMQKFAIRFYTGPMPQCTQCVSIHVELLSSSQHSINLLAAFAAESRANGWVWTASTLFELKIHESINPFDL